MKYILLILLFLLTNCIKKSNTYLIKNYTELFGENFIGDRYGDKDWKSKITKTNYYEIKNFELVPTKKRLKN